MADSNPTNLQAMRKTGYLGEGGFMMRNNLYGMNVERTVRYDVHELRINDWESMIGQSVEEALDLKPDQKAILGYYNGNPITAGGQKNYIENVFEMGDGKLGIEVRETVWLRHRHQGRSGQGPGPRCHQRRVHSHQGRTESLSPGPSPLRTYNSHARGRGPLHPMASGV